LHLLVGDVHIVLSLPVLDGPPTQALILGKFAHALLEQVIQRRDTVQRREPIFRGYVPAYSHILMLQWLLLSSPVHHQSRMHRQKVGLGSSRSFVFAPTALPHSAARVGPILQCSSPYDKRKVDVRL
jgi:hypothetical protein